VDKTGKPGEVVLKRFDAYHRGRPVIERIVIQPFKTLRNGWAELLRGGLDMVTTVPPDAVPFVKNEQVEVFTFSRRYLYTLAFNSKRRPFNSAAIRRALNMAIDRETIVHQIFHDAARPATGPFWPKNWAYDPSFQPYAFDPAEARKLLDRAGFPLPSAPDSDSLPARFRFRVLVPAGYSVLEDLALTLQKEFYDVGVDMQFDVTENNAEFRTRMARRDFDAAIFDINSGPTLTRPYIFWRSTKSGMGPYNIFGYENQGSEALFRSLLTAPNETSIRSTLRELQKTLTEDPPAAFLAWQDRTRAVRTTFGPYQEGGRDPIFTLWQWKPDKSVRVASNR
jgi:peptide/nickel transport system substrate-binding protein